MRAHAYEQVDSSYVHNTTRQLTSHNTTRQLTSEISYSVPHWEIFQPSVCLHGLSGRNLLRLGVRDVALHQVCQWQVLQFDWTDYIKRLYRLPFELELDRRKYCGTQMSVQQRLYWP